MVAMNFRMIDKGHDLKILWQVVVYILIEKFQMLYFVNVYFFYKLSSLKIGSVWALYLLQVIALIAFFNFVNPIKLVTPS